MQNIRTMPMLYAALWLFVLSGCVTVGPDYIPPETSIDHPWHTPLQGGLNADKMDLQELAAWWTTLNDPALNRLIKRAVERNLDLKGARSRVREARARRGITEAALFPTLDAVGTASRNRSSEKTGNGASRELYSLGFDAGWEFDLFGRVKRSVEAASADLQVAQENLRDVLVSLLAEVALNYVEARTYQARLAVTEANVEAQKETYELIQFRYQAGLSDELAVQQARYNLENARSQIPALRTGQEGTLNRLAVLLGEKPGQIHEELKKQKPIPVTPLQVAIGVPAETLKRRPDIRRAERELAAQTARVGVATGELYPRITLNGSIGLEALSFGLVFSSGSRTSGIGPRISWPIFQAGAIRKNIEVQSALQEQALLGYESAILSALEEVENALVAYAEEQRRRASLGEAVRAAQSAVDLARKKYEAGLTDFSDVLDAQRSLLSFQDDLVRSEGAVTANLVRLYKALGGGWTSLAPEANS